jgi:hypothetical protein
MKFNTTNTSTVRRMLAAVIRVVTHRTRKLRRLYFSGMAGLTTRL